MLPVLRGSLKPLEGLSHHLFTFLPERRSCGGIERISTNAFADSADDHVVRYDMTDVAVLAVLATHLVSGRDDAGPYRSRSSLWDRLPLKGRLTLCCKLLIHLLDHGWHSGRVQIATQFGLDASRMYSRSAYTTLAVALVEGDGKQDVRRLRPAVSNERFIGRPLEVRIVQIYVGEPVTGGRQVD